MRIRKRLLRRTYFIYGKSMEGRRNVLRRGIYEYMQREYDLNDPIDKTITEYVLAFKKYQNNTYQVSLDIDKLVIIYRVNGKLFGCLAFAMTSICELYLRYASWESLIYWLPYDSHFMVAKNADRILEH